MAVMRYCIKWTVVTTISTLLFGGIIVGSYGIWWSSAYKSWNDQAVQTYAHIKGVEIVNKTCQSKCNDYCFGSCAICNFTCSDVYLNVTYEHHHQHYLYLTNITDYKLLEEQLDDCCSIGRDIRIYFNSANPHDIRTDLYSTVIFWVVIILTLMFIVGCTAFIIYVYRRETAIFDYQSLYKDPIIDGNLRTLNDQTYYGSIGEPVLLNY